MRQFDSETLLRNARHTGPPEGSRDRLRARILAAAASGAVASATLHAAAAKGATAANAAAAGSSLAGTVLPWLLGGIVLGGLGSMSLTLLSSTGDSRPTYAKTVPTSTSRVLQSWHVGPAAQPFELLAPAASAGSDSDSRPSSNDSSAPRKERGLGARAVSSTSLAPSIERETALLTQAQRALHRADFNGALSELDRYDHEFPKGALREEALCARAIAGCSLGSESGRRAAAAFAQSYPSSPLLSRVRTACPDLESP